MVGRDRRTSGSAVQVPRLHYSSPRWEEQTEEAHVKKIQACIVFSSDRVTENMAQSQWQPQMNSGESLGFGKKPQARDS